MKLSFCGDVTPLATGIACSQKDLGFEQQSGGIEVSVQQGGTGLCVHLGLGKASIQYEKKVHFFRALAILTDAIKNGQQQLTVQEVPYFTLCGAMVDVSRNAVLTVDSVQNMLRKMAYMGLDTMMLYTEDVYQMEGYPYFGYMRGAYSQQELKACDDYADCFGIELIPCIQTLAHLREVVKWDFAADITDRGDILLAGSEKTYQFIADMIRTISTPLRSKRIHIGMDEAHDVGLGRYLKLNGYQPRFDILTNHLQRVVDITKDLGLQPMIWSDMFFRLGSKTGDYYDKNAVIPPETVEQIPPQLGLVYWDYYHTEQQDYDTFIALHKQLGSTPIFAGGLWTWAGNAIHYRHAFDVTNAALCSCKKQGVAEVFATMWGDDGAEVNSFQALLGLQLYAEHNYQNTVSDDLLKERFRAATGCDANAFLSMELDRFDKQQTQGAIANAAKYLLFQDVLLGLFDKNVEGLQLGSMYRSIAQEIKSFMGKQGEFDFLLETPYRRCKVLEKKWDVGLRLKQAYDQKNKPALQVLVDELKTIYRLTEELRLAHRAEWMTTNKPFGWEIQDHRYGGLLARIGTAIDKVEDFLEGRIDRIEELEVPRLYFAGENVNAERPLVDINQYQRISSPAVH